MKQLAHAAIIRHTPTISSNKSAFSLPAFILIFIIFILTFGFWNMYDHQIQKSYSAAIEPNMYQSIRQITDKGPTIINQSATLGNISIVEKVDNRAFLVSDGERVLLLLVPDSLNAQPIEEDMASNTPGYLIIRGTIKAYDQQTKEKYHLQNSDDPILKKQTIYLEITEKPEYNHKQLENDILNSQSI